VPNRARLRTHAATSVPHPRPKRRRRRPSTKSPASSGGSAVFSNAPEPKREGFANTTVARIRAPVRAAQSQAEPEIAAGSGWQFPGILLELRH
jgi:hypothetical protein